MQVPPPPQHAFDAPPRANLLSAEEFRSLSDEEQYGLYRSLHLVEHEVFLDIFPPKSGFPLGRFPR